MNAFSIYQVAVDCFCETQNRIVSLVQEITEVDRIYLLGASLNQRRNESIFNQLATAIQSVTDPYCLVLVPDTRGKLLAQLQDQIEQHCASVMPMTILVLETSQFDSWLAAGHAFAVQVYRLAPPILQRDDGYKGTVGACDAAAEQKRREIIYREGLKKVVEFMAGADLFLLRKQNRMAAFMLHQAAEQALGVLLKLGTGYYTCTHNIEKLLRYAGMVSNELVGIFPKNTESEKRLLQLLQKAYIDSRYKEDYYIGDTDLHTLYGRVRALEQLLKESNPVSVKLCTKPEPL